MHRMHRAAGILPILILLLAACAGPRTGAGGASVTAEPEMSAPAGSEAAVSSPTPSAGDEDGGEAADVQRVDIGVLAEDPGTLEGQQLAVLARVDRVLVEDVAFLTSPSASEEGRFPVIVTPDAEVNKEIAEAGVLWLEGSVVALTQEDLDAAGVDVSIDELGVDSDFAFVATTIDDPLSQAGDETDG